MSAAVALAVKPEQVPQELRECPRWLTWQKGKLKSDGSGRYEKLPCSVTTGAVANAHDPASWGSFDEALAAYRKRGHAGIAFDLPNQVEPFCKDGDGSDLYLVGLDFDQCVTWHDGKPVLSANVTFYINSLGKTYYELSPSGTGIRAFCLYPKPLATGNKNHIELYCGGRFLTVTGNGRGTIKKVSTVLELFHDEWFDAKEPESNSGDQQSSYQYAENCDDFSDALHTAYAYPKEYPEWYAGCKALAYLVAVQGWPERETVKIREQWENLATDADKSKNDKLWAAILESTRDRTQTGAKVTTHLSVLKLARAAGWVSKVPAADPVIQTIQDHFALIVLKKVGIVDRKGLDGRTNEGMAAPLSVLPREDGALLIRRLVKSQFPKDQFSDRSKQFMTSPATICYSGVEFNPKETTPGYLNLWVPPSVVPRQGEWTLIHEFLLVVICDSSDAAFNYLIRLIAHSLQRPWEKPGVMIAMLGGEGIGKGTLARILQRIWMATFLHVHQIAPIVGSFNGALERAFWVFLDEAIFWGDHAGTNALKALITEPTIFINEKNQPGRSMRSYHRFIAATNAEHFKHVDPDNRRDFVLKVSEARKGDTAYWDAVSQAIQGGEVEAMMFDLLQIDLSGFDVRKKPNTKELTQQKLQSLPPFQRWWFDRLTCGDIDDHTPDWPDFISTLSIRDRFKDATHGLRTYKQVTDRDIRGWMRKLCPSAKNEQGKEGLHRRRGFKLPVLAIARQEFEKFIGDAVDWE